MKKRILSLFLVAVMILSTAAIAPMTIWAAGDTWSDSNYVISTAADMAAFEAAVEGGNNFSGKTVKLAADVTLPSTWNGIGARSDYPFKGTFDGQGFTVTMSGHAQTADTTGALFNMVSGGSVMNLHLTGSHSIKGNFGASLIACIDGNVTISNVRVSTSISSGGNVSYAGGMVGFMNNNVATNVVFDGCVFDGTMNFGNQASNIGGFLGYTGHANGINYNKNTTIKNSVFAGTMMFNDTDVSEKNGGFIGWVNGGSGLPVAIIENSISIGNMTFRSGITNGEVNGVLFGNSSSSQCTLKATNVYYVNIKNPEKNGNMSIAWAGDSAVKTTNVVAKTMDEIAALTASNFADASKWVFGKEIDLADKTVSMPVPKSIYDTFFDLDPEDGFSTSNPIIASVEDMLAFEAAVEAGNAFSGKTVKLAADITLPSSWNGIGERDSLSFSGTFDGQGYTITMSNHNTGSINGALFCMVKNGTIKNLKLDGKIRWGAQNFQAGLVNCVAGDVTIENVQVSLNIESNNGIVSYAGGFVGFHDNSSTGTLVIDGCLFDGSILCKNQAQYVAAFVGYTGNAFASTSKTFVIKNSVYAGSMTFKDKDETRGCAIFVGYALGKSEVNPKVTVQDCISIGTIAFQNENAFSDSDLNAIAFGNYDSGKVTLAVKNLYYVDQANSQKTGNLLISSDGNGYTAAGAVKEMTKAEIASLTEANFSADAKMSFNNQDGVNIYYPCPTGLVPEEGWLPVLKYMNGSATVLGAQIRCTGEGDQYSGIRFVGLFEADKVSNANTADANFGIILIAKEFYEAAADKNSIEGLITAGGVDVKASQTDDSIEGYYRVNAVVYEITADHYTDEIVAIAYVDGALVGDVTTRSIYDVASKCVLDTNATAAQKTFCQQIIDTVGA